MTAVRFGGDDMNIRRRRQCVPADRLFSAPKIMAAQTATMTGFQFVSVRSAAAELGGALRGRR